MALRVSTNSYAGGIIACSPRSSEAIPGVGYEYKIVHPERCASIGTEAELAGTPSGADGLYFQFLGCETPGTCWL